VEKYLLDFCDAMKIIDIGRLISIKIV